MNSQDRRKIAPAEEQHKSARVEAQRRRVIATVVAELDRDCGSRALQLFKNGYAHNVFPHGTDLQHWLVRNLGKPTTAKLINAYVHAPCFYCKHGLEACGECDGRGHFDDMTICERCLGLGVARCYFCDGSGWMSIDCVPEGLQVPIILGRAHEAVARIDRLCDQIPARPSRRSPSAALAKCARILLKLNGLMGVLENEVVAVKDLNLSALHTEEWISTTVRSWVQTATAAEKRMHAALDCMSVSARLEAEVAPKGSTAKELSLARAEYYGDLSAARTFRGTGLSHPFLKRAVQELHEKERTTDPTADRPHEERNGPPVEDEKRTSS